MVPCGFDSREPRMTRTAEPVFVPARLALLLQHFARIGDDRETCRAAYPAQGGAAADLRHDRRLRRFRGDRLMGRASPGLPAPVQRFLSRRPVRPLAARPDEPDRPGLVRPPLRSLRRLDVARQARLHRHRRQDGPAHTRQDKRAVGCWAWKCCRYRSSVVASTLAPSSRSTNSDSYDGPPAALSRAPSDRYGLVAGAAPPGGPRRRRIRWRHDGRG